MKKEELKEAINLITKVGDFCDKMYDEFKWEVYETPLFDSAGRLFNMLIETNYTEEGQDCINWWVFENDCGKGDLEAFDEDEPICRTFDELYEHVKQYERV